MATTSHKFRKFALPDNLRRELVLLAAATGEDPADILADAVTLHLDALGELIEEDASTLIPVALP